MTTQPKWLILLAAAFAALGSLEAAPNNEVALNPLAAISGGSDFQFKQSLNYFDGDINALRTSSGRGLLHEAVYLIKENEALMCLMAGADPNLQDVAGKTPLHFAVEGPEYDRALIRDLLLLRGAKLNIQDHKNFTPLMTAIAGQGNAATVEVLLWLGADLNPPGVAPESLPMALATKRGDSAIIALLKANESSADAPIQGNSNAAPQHVQRSFTNAARMGDLATLEAMLADGTSIDSHDSEGKTALSRAISNQQEVVVVYLLMMGANPNTTNANGSVPYFDTCGWFGLTSDYMRCALIAAGAKADPTLPSGNSLLTHASSQENEHAMKWLMWMGVDPKAPTKVGTPMKVASERGNERAVKLLQEYGVTETPFENTSPEWLMAKAVKAGDIPSVQRLLDAGFPIDSVLNPGHGDNAMMTAINARRTNVAQFLLERGSNPNYQNPKNGETPLRCTVNWLFGENERFREKLLAAGANPNIPNNVGVTPFIEACKYGDLAPKVIQMLLYGADLSIRDKEGRNALDWAEKSNRKECANFLKAWKTPERETMLNQAQTGVVGSWADENSLFTYSDDGKRVNYRLDGSYVDEGYWKVDGELLTTTTIDKESGAEIPSQSYTYLLVDAKPDEMTILTLQNGSTYHAKRIASIPAVKQN